MTSICNLNIILSRITNGAVFPVFDIKSQARHKVDTELSEVVGMGSCVELC